MNVYKSKWKKDKFQFAARNGVDYFMFKTEVEAAAAKEPQFVANYHKITYGDGVIK